MASGAAPAVRGAPSGEAAAAKKELAPSKFTFYVDRSGNSTEAVARALAGAGWTLATADQTVPTAAVNFVWKPNWSLRKQYEPPPAFCRGNRALLKRQVWNHWRAVEPLCTKDSLSLVMSAFYKAVGEDESLALPPTFLVEPVYVPEVGGGGGPGATREWPGWAAFTTKFAECAADPSLKNLWLAKPTGSNRGIGIEVFSDYEDIRKFLDTKSRAASHGVNATWCLQKYLERPLLYKGRKFDLRVWACVLDTGDVYVHAPGYVRTSSQAFTLANNERYVHLTNYCQQVNNKETFAAFEEGNTLAWEDLVAYLDTDVLPKRQGAVARGIPRPASGVEVGAGAGGGDPPVSSATTGAQIMWGCGRNGVWGQIRKHIRDSMEALRGRGGARTQGFEENGFARRPPPDIVPPSRRKAGGGAAAAGSEASGGVDGSAGKGAGREEEVPPPLPAPTTSTSTASGGGRGPSSSALTSDAGGPVGPPASRHRFEFLGYDFMVSSDYQVHFIEVNTNPSLTYQAGWHEDFVDVMMARTLALVLSEAWPELYKEKYSPPPPCENGVKPEDGWQHVLNVYTAPLRHPGQAGPAAALAMAGLSRGATQAQGKGAAGKENGPPSPVKRTFQSAVGRVAAAAAVPPAAAPRASGVADKGLAAAAATPAAPPAVAPPTLAAAALESDTGEEADRPAGQLGHEEGGGEEGAALAPHTGLQRSLSTGRLGRGAPGAADRTGGTSVGGQPRGPRAAAGLPRAKSVGPTHMLRALLPAPARLSTPIIDIGMSLAHLPLHPLSVTGRGSVRKPSGGSTGRATPEAQTRSVVVSS